MSVYGVPCGSTDLLKERESAFYVGSWGSLRDYGYLRKLTTNQKVAGSSPAERAPRFPANYKAPLLPISPLCGVDHLSLREAPGETPEGVGLDVRHDVSADC